MIIILYKDSTSIKIRKVTLIQHYYLIYRIYLNFSNCLTNVVNKIFFNWDQDHNFHLVNIMFLHDSFSNLEQFLSSPLIWSSSSVCLSWSWHSGKIKAICFIKCLPIWVCVFSNSARIPKKQRCVLSNTPYQEVQNTV